VSLDIPIVTALVENGSYSRRYGRRRAYVTKGLYITSRVTACLFPSLSLALDPYLLII
jgi:hypothetical protein